MSMADVGRQIRIAERVAGRQSNAVGVGGVAIFTIIGICLVVNGCDGDTTESTKENGSAIRQCVYAIQYGSGFLLLGLAAIMELLRKICNAVRRPSS